MGRGFGLAHNGCTYARVAIHFRHEDIEIFFDYAFALVYIFLPL